MGDSESPVLAKIASYRYHSPNYAASVLRKNGQHSSSSSSIFNNSSSLPQPSNDKKTNENSNSSKTKRPAASSSGGATTAAGGAVTVPSDRESMKKVLSSSDSDDDTPADSFTKKLFKFNRKRVRISSESSQDNPESPPWSAKKSRSGSGSIPSSFPGNGRKKNPGPISSDSDSEDESSQSAGTKDLLAGASAKDQLALLRRQRMTEEEEEERGKGKRQPRSSASRRNAEEDDEEEEFVDLTEDTGKEAPSVPEKLSKNELKMEVFDETKGLSVCVVEEYVECLEAKANLDRLLRDCTRRSFELQEAVHAIKKGSHRLAQIQPPSLLASGLYLKPYQEIGLNWLALMHEQKMNAVLADEMGLGKTIQVIAFLAHLRETQRQTVHLIVVPSSTIDNWGFELKRWWPGVKVLNYYGSQEDRAHIRYSLTKGQYRDEAIDILLTTYNMVQSRGEDRSFFKKFHINYVVYDEAHMLKNFTTKRYQALLKIKSVRKLLLTGTPLQNNLVELMSLMHFVMPELFRDFRDDLGQIMGQFQQKNGMSSGGYDQEKIDQAKQIMMPFVLRRLKSEVLSQLPSKSEVITRCPLTERQREIYDSIADAYRDKDASEIRGSKGMRALMELRKAANHPLLLRRLYSDNKLRAMSTLICKEVKYRDSNPVLVMEDMEVMSDFELYRLCNDNQSISDYCIPSTSACESGKCVVLDRVLKEFKEKGEKVLLFSQFVMVLDILEVYLQCRGHKYLRLDGQTNVVDRQGLINSFNTDEEKFVFLLSTKAGGLGINLTSASVIILHDIDYNPYNDRQAEDRCHRVGQTKEVTVIKLIGENTVEESMLVCAQKKLELETKVTGNRTENMDADDIEDNQSVESLLRQALSL